MRNNALEGLRVPLSDGRSGRQRKRMKRIAITVGVVVLISAAIFFVKKLKSFQQQYDNPATEAGESRESQEAAKIAARHFPHEVLKAMDLSADPCQDFYSYACGTFQEITQVEADQNEWARAWSGVSARNNELLREVVETDQGLAGDFYRSCMNMTRINELGSTPIEPYKKALDSLRSCKEHSHVPFARFHPTPCGLAALQELLVQWHMSDIKVFFDWSVEVNPHDPSKYAVNLMQDGITLPDPKWYYSGSTEANSKLKGLEEVMKKVFMLAGETKQEAEEDAKATLSFETELAKLFKDATQERTSTQGEYSLQSLDALCPSLALPKVLSAMAGPYKTELSNAKVLIRNPDYFRGIQELLPKTPASHIRAYMLFRVAFILGADLSEEFLAVGQELQQVVVGQQTRVPRWYKCYKSVNNALPDYVGKIFVQRYFSMDILSQAQDMLSRIRDVFQEEILQVPWMEDKTKSLATYKLADMFFSIGFPPTWSDYRGLSLSGDFVQDGDRLYKWYIRHAFARLSRPVQRNRWGTTSPAMVDAFYSYDKNGIFVPAGILQKPFFSTTYRAARNFGAIGTILGHEMTHGFDDQGRKFNPEGRMKQWWSDADKDAFEQRASCVVELYNSMKLDGKRVNGELTLGENIADIGGVKLAYRAMERELREKEGQAAPSRTDRQLFFVSQGQNWCTKARKQAEELQLLTDPHAPDRWRVNGPLSQTPEFAEAFQCSPGSPMNPRRRCEVW
uniref:Peptidase M13 C-terminal domain-containing protein n=1 Tax=Hanusia phi TaxID=3032 RepID=A0A7S0DV73_9CRYP|mmetsp:Transcript_10921/g.24787  ORF Transcript_10921/g.24787 Transcript_10921/m.24787 type:complete len:737 (+) Transcript_10921:166-2376(+)